MELFTIKTNEIFPCELLLYGRYKYERDWQSVLHSHQHTEIFYVLEGKGEFLTNHSKIEMKKGMLIINNAGVLHTEISDKNAPLEYVIFAVKNTSFTVQNSVFDLLLPTSELKERDSFAFDLHSSYQKITEIIKTIDEEINRKDNLWENACLTEFNKFFILISRRLKLLTAPIQNQGKQNIANFTKEYFHHHYSDDLTLETLAQIFFVNKYYLAHEFKRKFGVSPIRYLNKLRCEKARELLLSSNQNVSTISASVGFSNASYFSLIYKKIYGESPQKTKASLKNG